MRHFVAHISKLAETLLATVQLSTDGLWANSFLTTIDDCNTASKTNAGNNFIKKAHAQKSLCLRTLHTFAFACLRTSSPKSKVKRVNKLSYLINIVQTNCNVSKNKDNKKINEIKRTCCELAGLTIDYIEFVDLV